MRDNTSPNELSNMLNSSINAKDITSNYLNNVSKFLKSKEPSLKINKISDGSLRVAYNIMANDLNSTNGSNSDNSSPSFIDLKEYFAQSPKRKMKKDGGWYMVIPVGNHTTRELRHVVGSREWDRISHIDMNSTTSINSMSVDSWQQQIAPTGGLIPEVVYNWKSSNITRNPIQPKGLRAHYINFRTVSNTSDPMSWIVGRQNLSDNISNSNNSELLAKSIGDIIVAHVNSYNNM